VSTSEKRLRTRIAVGGAVLLVAALAWFIGLSGLAR